MRHGFGASHFALFRSEPNSRYFGLFFWLSKNAKFLPFSRWMMRERSVTMYR